MKLNNTYYILRHGEALSNKKDVVSSWPETFENSLTERGRLQVQESVQILKEACIQHGKTLDLIVASDMLRTRQTAEIVAKEFNVQILYDQKLREISFGAMNGGPISDLSKLFTEEGQRLKEKMEEGESYEDVLERAADFLHGIESRFKGKTILIVSHECPLWILEGFVQGWTLEEAFRNIPREKRIHTGEVKKIS